MGRKRSRAVVLGSGCACAVAMLIAGLTSDGRDGIADAPTE